MLQPVSVGTKSLADYTHLAGRPLIQEIRELAEPLQGLRVLHLSATAFGGGVAEILYTLIPLMTDVGIDAQWEVMLGREEFYNVTKRLHNALQGNPDSLSDEEWRIFERYNELNADRAVRRLGRDHRARPAAGRGAPARAGQGEDAGSGAATSTCPRPTRPRSTTSCRSCATTTRRSGTCRPTCRASLNGATRRREHLPAGDRPAVAQEHGPLARGRRVRVRPVRHRRRPAAALPGVALRPVERSRWA